VRRRAALAVLAVLAALLAPGAGPAAAEEPPTTEPPPTEPPAGDPPAEEPAGAALAVTDAQFRWGINSEAGNAGFAPGTNNLLSAGVVPDAGPGQLITEDRWSAAAGEVRIEKRQADGGYALATWAGLTTTPAGEPITSPTAGLTSGHQVVIDGGTGEVDPIAGTAAIHWTGDFSVVYYSGLTSFTVSDPLLTVADGRGQVTATLGGFGADRDDPTRWEPLPATEVVLATLTDVSLSAAGFSVTPDYLGVAYDLPPDSGFAAQQRTGDAWGAFPASFVDFQGAVGQAPYWYSSGSSTDRFKVPLPLTVSVDAATPVDPPDPVEPPAPPAPPANELVLPPPTPAPRPDPTPDPTPAPVAAAPAATAPAARPPAVVSPPAAATTPALDPAAAWAPAPESVRVREAGATDLAALLPRSSAGDLAWWAAGAFLLVVALVVALQASGRLVLGRRPDRTERS
jgi:hypothetical protein